MNSEPFRGNLQDLAVSLDCVIGTACSGVGLGEKKPCPIRVRRPRDVFVEVLQRQLRLNFELQQRNGWRGSISKEPLLQNLFCGFEITGKHRSAGTKIALFPA